VALAFRGVEVGVGVGGRIGAFTERQVIVEPSQVQDAPDGSRWSSQRDLAARFGVLTCDADNGLQTRDPEKLQVR
jgi:hypothetical protein